MRIFKSFFSALILNNSLASKFIESSGENYKLKTSETKQVLECPENDFTAQSVGSEVELRFTKKCKITAV